MSQNEMHFDVAIIGAGFSGTMVAVHLFKDGVAFRINWGGGYLHRIDFFRKVGLELPEPGRRHNEQGLRKSDRFLV